MQYMLQASGIQCVLVTGFTNGERHGWNLVRVNGEYYYLDPNVIPVTALPSVYSVY